jgi:hypothetical protein
MLNITLAEQQPRNPLPNGDILINISKTRGDKIHFTTAIKLRLLISIFEIEIAINKVNDSNAWTVNQIDGRYFKCIDGLENQFGIDESKGGLFGDPLMVEYVELVLEEIFLERFEVTKKSTRLEIVYVAEYH